MRWCGNAGERRPASGAETRFTKRGGSPNMCLKNRGWARSRGCAIVLMVLLGCAMTGFAAGWKEGALLPDMARMLPGEPVPALKGKVVLVDFWASWCGPCKKSFPELGALHKDYAADGLVVLGINVDEKDEKAQAFLKDHPAEFTVLRDRKQALIQDANVESMPSSFLVDREGRIRYVHRGFRGEETVKAYREQIEQLLGNANKEAKP